MHLKTTVIVCTRNRIDDLMGFLPSLALQTDQVNELIIVDSSNIPLQSQYQFQELFSSYLFPNTVLRYVHEKPGLTYQRNVGIKLAHGNILYFFDDDVILDKQYIYEMNRAFENHPDYMAGMGDISNIKRNVSCLYQLFRSVFLLPREQASGYFTWSGMPTHPYGTNTFKQIEVLGGCCMAFKREVFTRFVFDEALYGYAAMEDCDIARRVSYTMPIFFNPRAKLQHRESPAARDTVVERNAMFMRNYSYLFFKNFYTRRRLKIVAYGWTLFGLFLESVLMRDGQRLYGYWLGLKRFVTKK